MSGLVGDSLGLGKSVKKDRVQRTVLKRDEKSPKATIPIRTLEEDHR